MKRLLLVATVVVLAGCTGFLPDDGDSGRELPDEVGEVENVSYDEDIDVDASDGLSEAELDPFVKRSMARVEVVRERSYKRPVDVELITRAEYREAYNDQFTDETRAAWRNQLWKGLFIVGDDRDAVAVLDETFGAAVQGFYDPGEETIFIVSDNEEARINKQTLVHELVHAIQHQHFGLGSDADTWDAEQAYESVIEGEAAVVPDRYLDNCDDWGCLRPGGDATASSDADPDVLLVVRLPYTAGADFVEAIEDEGGWEAVDDLHENPPDTTAEVIHPDRHGDIDPADVEVEDRSTPAWSRFDHDPVGETLGEASMFAMLATNGGIETDDIRSYDHPATEGWAGDQFVPYRNGDGFGYVWETVWESSDDAREFEEAYEQMLDEQGGLARGANSHTIQSGPFEGGYRVLRAGSTVRIVHAPSVRDLSAVHAN